MLATALRPDGRAGLLALCLATTLLAGLAAEAAPERGSPADQDACTPDVFRLCSDLIPDETRIVACLESKREQLSPACGKVFAPAPEKAHRRRHRATA